MAAARSPENPSIRRSKVGQQLKAIEAEGAIAFMRGDNVIPFGKS